jgi:3-isopropylmalate dehydrogenase
MIVRELTGGVYFGEPRGIFVNPDGSRYGINTHRYSDTEIIRVGRLAFELARKRRGNVVSVDKSNVMEAGLLWREEIQKLHDSEFSDVVLSHMYADNCAMQLVRNPQQFDVVVTDNLFGDVLSDCAAMCCGSLGMLPSASLGPEIQGGRRLAMYEPIHGSAPDIAGQQLANPTACILSVAMMLRHSFGMEDTAELIERSVARVLADGIRTADVAESPATAVKTAVMGSAIVRELERQSWS